LAAVARRPARAARGGGHASATGQTTGTRIISSPSSEQLLAQPERKPSQAVAIIARLLAALVANYAIVYFSADALGLALVRAEWTSRADAVLISTNLALLLAPGVAIWAFSPMSLRKAVGVPFAVAAVLMLMAGLLQP